MMVLSHVCVLPDCRFSAAYQAINSSVSEMMEDHARLSEEVNTIATNSTHGVHTDTFIG